MERTTFSTAHKQAISAAKKGKPITLEHRNAIKLAKERVAKEHRVNSIVREWIMATDLEESDETIGRQLRLFLNSFNGEEL